MLRKRNHKILSQLPLYAFVGLLSLGTTACHLVGPSEGANGEKPAVKELIAAEKPKTIQGAWEGACLQNGKGAPKELTSLAYRHGLKIENGVMTEYYHQYNTVTCPDADSGATVSYTKHDAYPYEIKGPGLINYMHPQKKDQPDTFALSANGDGLVFGDFTKPLDDGDRPMHLDQNKKYLRVDSSRVNIH